MSWPLYLSGVVAVITLPLRLGWWLIAAIVHLILVLLSPFTTMGAYLVECGRSILNFIASLQPIYTFLACGACIGVMAGLTMSCTSGVIFTVLGMYDRGPRSLPETPVPSTPSERPGTGKTEDSSSYETDWQLLNNPPPKRRRRSPGIWTQTIHEEDDDDS